MSDTHVKRGNYNFILSLFLFKYFSAEIEMKLADEPEFTYVEYLTPNHLDHFFSNSITFFD